MIRVEQLAKAVGSDKIPVLKEISFDMQQGEFIGIVGGSGSGKSTLLRLLALKESWDRGKFTVHGTDIFKAGYAGKKQIKREWAYLEQNPELFTNKTVLKNVLIGRSGQTPWWRMLTGMVRSDDYMGAMDVIESVGLLDKAHMKAGQLSGGERQRVAVARALTHGAKVILADEPVIGLDPKSADSVLENFKQLCEEEHMTVIAVLPIELAERYATRIWGLSEGRLAFDIRGRRLTLHEKNKI
ncbi:phosphonate ABC transporter ATP-binding protein [Paenibacillus gallinarum]|uniref:ATP-binding cassette domain-containing protein n=1 Tax=Paenibacillus gallinarum TaxID=2762232 RepID=A0ABR8SXS8_9BACL|nr:ATP-binding cassette domain-containing protein [Paenibacillus gallinarum]MBD7968205.1 ATP-binding cassette domain-containing protein [Paenibacillus gallinarum]